MKGKYRITVQNKRIRYDFELKRNITIIRGDSATGKTALIDMVREFYQNGADGGVELKCERVCVVLEGRNWEVLLAGIHESIVFIDEGNDFVASKDFAARIQNSDNYYVIVTRERLSTLPYSVEEIYGIRDSGKYGSLKRTYNQLYHLYSQDMLRDFVVPHVVITEDSNSGYQFFKYICEKNGQECVSANGKSNIFQVLASQKSDKVLVIADGAAFGPEMEKLMRLIKIDDRFTLYLPESFEWLILNSGLITDSKLNAILENPQDYIESSNYFSWEQFFNHVLVQKTNNNYLKYNKRSLNPVYLQDNIVKKILDSVDKIKFSEENQAVMNEFVESTTEGSES